MNMNRFKLICNKLRQGGYQDMGSLEIIDFEEFGECIFQGAEGIRIHNAEKE